MPTPNSSASATNSTADGGYTVDANVFIRWFVPQPPGVLHARAVRDRLLRGEARLVTPDSVRYEVAHVLRKIGLLEGLLSKDEYLAAVRAIDDLGVKVEPTNPDHLEQAAGLAAQYNLRIFDAMVVGTSLRSELPILTSDGKLARAMSGVLPIELLRDP